MADTAGGKQPVIIKNAKYSLTSGASKVTLPESTGQLTIKKLGDANGDGDVTEADVEAVPSTSWARLLQALMRRLLM